jgi:hypothetical protein
LFYLIALSWTQRKERWQQVPQSSTIRTVDSKTFETGTAQTTAPKGLTEAQFPRAPVYGNLWKTPAPDVGRQ